MRKGFTLIELLIVLAVIAALMAIVTPIALNAVRRAQLTQIASNIRNIKSAAETYVTIERPTADKADLITELENKNYLTTTPGSGYAANLTYNKGNITITIYYTGGNAEVADLQKIYSEVKAVTVGSNTYPGVVVNITSW